MAIVSFADKLTEQIWLGQAVKKLPRDLQWRARIKLRMLHNAQNVDDLRSPPGNRLELLRGNRAGQHSIRINQQWRICFYFKNNQATSVEIVDYH